jgi:hypothetical protein
MNGPAFDEALGNPKVGANPADIREKGLTVR